MHRDTVLPKVSGFFYSHQALICVPVCCGCQLPLGGSVKKRTTSTQRSYLNWSKANN